MNVHPASMPPEKILEKCEVTRLRRSGPGGQHRNKVETAVVLHHLPTGVKAEANELRSQSENQTVALFRLRINLALEVRMPSEENAMPSELWRSRLRGEKISINESHADFPAILAEALDAIVSHQADVKTAAEQLHCTPSQLLKLLKQEPRAFQFVNQQREKMGLKRLI
jgi:protein subunit release factor A